MKSFPFYLTGFGWLFYAFYEWIIVDRQLNVGYPDKSIIDLASFIIPLLALFGFMKLFKNLRGNVTTINRIGKNLIYLGLVMISLGKFGGNWIYSAPFPLYMMLFFLGSIILTIGLLLSLTFIKGKVSILPVIVVSLLTSAFPILPQLLIPHFGIVVATDIEGIIGILLGISWILLGLFVEVIQKNNNISLEN